ncbi:MAG: hypothetical protein A2655_04390 [Candidatus Yanofskybacteria bacterium RIFCSPHIGHO2_01_FULL_43_42]|uniref:Uncharacterized protein n=1 Tax=Candidatus Yanofskybacteria bacterium RIFCSPLOWO2_01_FULL_43_22 TaxID=1802695 RepID=A0A1F8GDI6_9BACT|nr:MAG: hypothetical protein A2655_04390 [Candidatus Yanofskybacteria bacterium RIFCSPHIGHO2_01_FULL_43_42]OGN13496.1 MAG: hypothetical protein A3D48_01950 [Candidatus Yanofskybacteria bacterium RIFCSPHIGHO2_02_FULL_43_17]OGN23351.1 MAG: hypothetical protein A3A13_04515 [Candidatus Yanofskybacteria bacterium RIFCSPLOWO2_01_FULL_43_22]
MFWAVLWFVLFIFMLLFNLLMGSSFTDKLKTIKAILEDKTKTPDGKVASVKVIVSESLKDEN